MAVWTIRSLHFSRTESRYLVGSMTYGVAWDQVYGTLRQLALPESRAFTAYTGDDTAINGAACYLPDRIGHLFKCRPPPPCGTGPPLVTRGGLGTLSPLHCLCWLCRWLCLWDAAF